MKSKAILVLGLSITLVLSITLILVSAGLSKPKPKSELITFTGDLAGSQEVVGCCPNAGPFPEYTMTLSETFSDPMPGTHDGIIFMNYFGAGKNKQSYIVQFEWTEDDITYFIEIRGGDIDKNRKTKILTVTFNQAPCEIWINREYTTTVPVDFVLTRNL